MEPPTSEEIRYSTHNKIETEKKYKAQKDENKTDYATADKNNVIVC